VIDVYQNVQIIKREMIKESVSVCAVVALKKSMAGVCLNVPKTMNVLMVIVNPYAHPVTIETELETVRQLEIAGQIRKYIIINV
tara:strand:+ start:21042 stop:21293 length:252 start_codon:yes stop_codon:yes gene_type:complete